MRENGFSKDVTEVINVLVGLYRHQNKPDIVDILERANAHIELIDYDNWNGGTYTYALRLDVPISVFATIESRVKEIEKSIEGKLELMYRSLTNEYLNSVTIIPVTGSAAIGPKPKPAESQTEHLWRPGLFRLFLSHVSAHKVAIAGLKNDLLLRGISGFVAHEDIAPSLEWESEIDLALRSMDALLALLTHEFHSSKWTDQEVGFALGRGVLVIPVRLGLNPYGFIGKVQGLAGSLEQSEDMADTLVQTLLNHPSTQRAMRKALVSALQSAFSYDNARKLSRIIARVKDFTDEEKRDLQHACKDNNQVADANGVPESVCFAIGLPLLQAQEAAFGDDDIPF